MNELQMPDYRVRLFLSVDLTGSTAFKANNNSVFEWRKIFSRFYDEFPTLYVRKFSELCDKLENLKDCEKETAPKLWKTIGDEILFVNRVTSITHLGAYISAFSDALMEFGGTLSGDLNTKGNGWLAAFPSPNCSIPIKRDDGDTQSIGFDDLPTERFEAAVDNDPSKFDFLGKGIDGGFRISRNSAIDTFTISPALAYLLTRAQKNEDTTGFTASFQFHEPQSFKGVIGGKPYPIVSLDTNRNPEAKEVKKLEADLLNKPSDVKHSELENYLEKFIHLHQIEMPILPLALGQAVGNSPSHYQNYVTEWQDANKQKLKDEADMAQKDDLVSDDAALAEVRVASNTFFPEGNS